jgi:hypothetical protein
VKGSGFAGNRLLRVLSGTLLLGLISARQRLRKRSAFWSSIRLEVAAPPFTTHSIAFETELVEKLGERVDLDEVSLDMARYADSDMQEALVIT